MPHAVEGAVQLVAVINEILCADFEYDRLTVPAADLDGGCVVGRDVNELACHRFKSVFHNRIEKACRCAVIQELRRFGSFHFDYHAGNRMTLIRADLNDLLAHVQI